MPGSRQARDGEIEVVPLLDRETQLASLGKYAAEARQGEGRLVFIAGEAGVGKSALVEEVQRSLPRAAWYWGACDGLFIPRPLGPLLDIASTLGGELLELCRTDAPRETLFSALLRLVSAPGALHVLVVEDVHWADEATIDLLRFLGRRIRDASVLVLVTYRDEGVTVMDPLRIALGDLATQRSVRRIDLPPLSADAVALLADGSGLDPAALYRLTGGNPFYVSQVVQPGICGAVCGVPAGMPIRYQRPSMWWNQTSMRRGIPLRLPSVMMSMMRSAVEEPGPMARARATALSTVTVRPACGTSCFSLGGVTSRTLAAGCASGTGSGSSPSPPGSSGGTRRHGST